MTKQKINKNYNIWGVKNPFLFGDIDSDKRKDNIDCEPFNPFKQHISKRRRKEIDDLPIVIGEDIHHLYSKEAKQKYPKIRQQVYSTLNRHPELISRIKKVQKGWEEKTGKKEYIIVRMGENPRFGKNNQMAYSQEREDADSAGRVIMEGEPFGYNTEKYKKALGVSNVPLKKQDMAAGILHHELTHQEQYLRDPKAMNKATALHTKEMVTGLETPYSIYKKIGKKPPEKILRQVWEKQRPITEKRYRANPYEVEADRKARKHLEERIKKPSEEEIAEGYRKTMEEDEE